MTDYVARVKNYHEMKDGDEVELFIQDLSPGPRKYDGQRVRAIVARSSDKLPGGGGDRLFLQSVLGRPYGEPWFMRITRKLDLGIPGRPYSQAGATGQDR